jgi:hypothetical protein
MAECVFAIVWFVIRIAQFRVTVENELLSVNMNIICEVGHKWLSSLLMWIYEVQYTV